MVCDTLEKKRQYIIGLKPAWFNKINAMSEYQINALYKKLSDEQMQLQIKETLERYQKGENND